MGKQLNPLEKEFLIRRFRMGTDVSLKDFCEANQTTTQSMKKWMAQYDEAGLEGLARNADFESFLPEGIDRTEENYKREILRLRIENERLKKNYTVRKNEDGTTTFIRLREKSSR